jgi:hypothetical protein
MNNKKLKKELQHIFDDTLLFFNKYEKVLTIEEEEKIKEREYNYNKN